MNNYRASGTVASEPKHSNTMCGEKFYEFDLACKRLSGVDDVLPVLVSELFASKILKGERIEVSGEIRSRNTDENGKRKLVIYVFAKDISKPSTDHDVNEFRCTSYICKGPIYRTTPLGREIADLMIATHREKNLKSDYLPVVCWGRNAIRATYFPVGAYVEIKGRLQSREYQKETENGIITRTAWEVSAQMITEAENNED